MRYRLHDLNQPIPDDATELDLSCLELGYSAFAALSAFVAVLPKRIHTLDLSKNKFIKRSGEEIAQLIYSMRHIKLLILNENDLHKKNKSCLRCIRIAMHKNMYLDMSWKISDTITPLWQKNESIEAPIQQIRNTSHYVHTVDLSKLNLHERTPDERALLFQSIPKHSTRLILDLRICPQNIRIEIVKSIPEHMIQLKLAKNSLERIVLVLRRGKSFYERILIGASEIADFLKETPKHIRILDLSDNSLHKRQASDVITIVESVAHIQSLHLSRNKLGTMPELPAIVKAASKHVRRLNLSDNMLDKSALGSVFAALSRELSSLNLSDNNLVYNATPKAFGKLPSSLKQLILCGNRLGTPAAPNAYKLSELLSEAKCELSLIDLSHNGLGNSAAALKQLFRIFPDTLVNLQLRQNKLFLIPENDLRYACRPLFNKLTSIGLSGNLLTSRLKTDLTQCLLKQEIKEESDGPRAKPRITCGFYQSIIPEINQELKIKRATYIPLDLSWRNLGYKKKPELLQLLTTAPEINFLDLSGNHLRRQPTNILISCFQQLSSSIIAVKLNHNGLQFKSKVKQLKLLNALPSTVLSVALKNSQLVDIREYKKKLVEQIAKETSKKLVEQVVPHQAPVANEQVIEPAAASYQAPVVKEQAVKQTPEPDEAQPAQDTFESYPHPTTRRRRAMSCDSPATPANPVARPRANSLLFFVEESAKVHGNQPYGTPLFPGDVRIF